MPIILPPLSELVRLRAALITAAFAVALTMFQPAEASAQPVLDLGKLERDGAVRLQTEIATNVDRDLDVAAVISGAATLDLASAAAPVPQVYSPDGDVWMRFQLTNSSREPQAGKFVINFSYLERVDLFEVLPGGGYRTSAAGSAQPASGSAIATAYPTFQMMLAPAETRTYYVRVRSNSILFFPMRIVSESRFSHAVTRDTMIWSLIIGTALAFALYAASMVFGSARAVYRAYLCFSLSAACYIFVSSGLLSALLASGLAVNLNTVVYISQAMVIAFGTIFITRFLEMRKAAPRLYMVFMALAGVAALTGISFMLPDWLVRLSYVIATGFGPLLQIGGLAWLTFRGVAGARSLLIAWTPCFLAVLWIYLRLFNITPYLQINHFVVPLAFAFTLAHLAGILSGRVREAELWANNDMLTGLGNRRMLSSILELETREPSKRYGAAIAVDLDNFKPVNDRLGHAAGDAVLMAVGDRMRAVFKGKGDAFRLGGDEFLILTYSSLSRMEIINLAADYLDANRKTVVHAGTSINIDASIGVAFRDDHAGIDAMLKQADQELYAVKQAGRGMVRVADQRKQERRQIRRTISFLTSPGTFFARPGERGPVPANDPGTPQSERAKR